MEKKYQIFISSTYEDLKEERKKVEDTILSMYQFPIGMEMFSAADEKQWEIIKETIDSSDYYILIIGHRYGSVIKEGEYAGISYTQKEFRYALEKKIPVLAFFIDNSVSITPEKMEQDINKKKKLEKFKDEVKTGRLVEWWENKYDLANKVTNALNKQISRKDRPGWIRTQSLETDNLQRKIVELNKTVEELDENKEELQKKILKLNKKRQQLIRINRKVKVRILLRIGSVVILLVFFLSGGLPLIMHDKDNWQMDENIEMYDDNAHADERVQASKGNAGENENTELQINTTQKDVNTKEIQVLEENREIIDWEWEYEGITDNWRRFLINTPSELGIDVSAYQKTIDWEKVRADGIDFAVIRVGYRGYEYGNISLDSKFKENMDGAIANDIKVGVYFYSQATNQDEMDEEINELLKSIEGYNIDYPVVIELVCEKGYRTYEVFTIEEYIDLINYFCTKIKQSGYTPMIYGSMEWFQQFPADAFGGYYKWVYSSDSTPDEIDNCVIWQYTNNAVGVDGIDDGIKVSINLSVYDGEND